MAEVLIVDSLGKLKSEVSQALGERFQYTKVTDVDEALKLLQYIKFDSIILNLENQAHLRLGFFNSLPSNFNLKETPVLVVSSQAEVSHKVEAFALGASDFIEAPFNPLEFKARFESKINFTRSPIVPLVRDGLKVDVEDQKVYIVDPKIEALKRREHIGLTPLEFKIFYSLFKKRGQALSRKDLAKNLEFSDFKVSSRKIDAHISNIRKKLQDKARLLSSVYGVGYVYRGE